MAALREALGLPPVAAPMRPLAGRRSGLAGPDPAPPSAPKPEDAAEALRRRFVLAALAVLVVLMAVAIVAAWWGR